MNFYIKQCENEHWGPNRPAACYFARRPNGLRKNRTWSRIPTEPFSPNGLIRERDDSLTFVTIAKNGNPTDLTAKRFPHSLQVRLLANQTVPTIDTFSLICCIRGNWQAVRSAGLGSRMGSRNVSQAVGLRATLQQIKYPQICTVHQIQPHSSSTYPNIPL